MSQHFLSFSVPTKSAWGKHYSLETTLLLICKIIFWEKFLKKGLPQVVYELKRKKYFADDQLIWKIFVIYSKMAIPCRTVRVPTWVSQAANVYHFKHFLSVLTVLHTVDIVLQILHMYMNFYFTTWRTEFHMPCCRLGLLYIL